MRLQQSFIGASMLACALSTSLDQVCTASHVRASLPKNGTILGIRANALSATANPVYNASISASENFPAAVFDYCNVTFSYGHAGLDDVVHLQYWLPSLDQFQRRFLATGGGGFAINSGTSMLGGGLQYGAVAGITDGGFGDFDTNLDQIFLLANGSINYESLYMFANRGIAELTRVGKAFSRNFFSMNPAEKLYTYYQGCSEGGREGWSQVQRYAEEYDGVIAGAPAFRFAQQQVQHLYSNVVENTLSYYPPTCELDKIVNETILACDPLDGKVDGVVARSDLCRLHFDVKSLIGKPYSCAATTPTPFDSSPSRKHKRQMGPGASPKPAQNGTVTAEAAAVVQKILDGLHDSRGKRAYISYQPAASFADATTTYNNMTGQWELNVNSMGGEYVTKFLQLVNIDNLPSLENVTFDTLRDWMQRGWVMYEDSLQTTLPDLTAFQSNGGKILSYHGESDDSIPAGSSVHYHESVRNVMYPNMPFNESSEALGEWYRLFLVPGAGHCSSNTLQPNGPFPNTNLAVMINWVEGGVKPETLNATILQGENEGQEQQICAWPLRPFWNKNAIDPECVYDQESIDTWMYDFDAYKMPLY